MLKTTGSSVASAFRIDDDKVVGGGDGVGAESGGSIVERKVGLIAPTKVPVEYANFTFSPDLASGLPEHTKINDRAIELVDINEFIRPSKLPAGVPRLFPTFLLAPLTLMLRTS